MLTQRAAALYLLERGFVSAESIVESDLVIADASRRNRNFKVISERDTCYLLKQGITADGIETIAREAAVYQRLQSSAVIPCLSR
jgi:hypothetical protein